MKTRVFLIVMTLICLPYQVEAQRIDTSGYYGVSTYDGIMIGQGWCGIPTYGNLPISTNLRWELYDNGRTYKLVISGQGEMCDIFGDTGCDDKMQQYLWTCKSAGISELVIEEGVTSITAALFSDWSDYQWQGCVPMPELESVTIPESLTKCSYGNHQIFCHSRKIKEPVYNSHMFIHMPYSYKGSYTIPDGIERIEGNAFSYARGLTELTIPKSVQYIGTNFAHCSSLKKIILEEGHTRIDHFQSFVDCDSLTDIVLPQSLTWIYGLSFKDCESLSKIELPQNLTHIGDIYLENFFDDGINIGWKCHLSKLNIPQKIKYIGDLGGIHRLTIDTLVYDAADCDTIGNLSRALIKNLVIGDNVEIIPDSAFYGCTELTEVTIPENVKYIGNAAFAGCTSLKSLTWNSLQCELGDSVFPDSISIVVFGDNIKCIPDRLCENFKCLTSVKLSNGFESIGTRSFAECISLHDIVIPYGVKTIADSAFFGCTQLSDITLSASVQKLSNGAFKRCGDSLMVRCYSVEPPEIMNAFDTGIYTYLKVPCEGVNLYRADSAWTDYFNTNHIAGIEVPQITLIACREYGYAEISVPVDCESHEVTVNAISNDNSRFICWRNTDDEVVTQANPYTFIVTSDTTLVAEFIRLVNVDLQPNDADKGRVEGGGKYDIGEQVEITAVPNNHFEFVRWSDGNTDNPRIITVTSDTSLQAIFDIRKYTVTLDVNDETMGMVFGDGEYEYGKNITVIAKPNDGYAFEKWSDEETKSVRLIKVNEDISLTAYFRPDDTATDGASITDFVRISSDGTLHIEGYDGKRMAVYTSDGALFYAGEIKELYLPVPGVYILRIGGETVKVVRP